MKEQIQFLGFLCLLLALFVPVWVLMFGKFGFFGFYPLILYLFFSSGFILRKLKEINKIIQVKCPEKKLRKIICDCGQEIYICFDKINKNSIKQNRRLKNDISRS